MVLDLNKAKDVYSSINNAQPTQQEVKQPLETNQQEVMQPTSQPTTSSYLWQPNIKTSWNTSSPWTQITNKPQTAPKVDSKSKATIPNIKDLIRWNNQEIIKGFTSWKDVLQGINNWTVGNDTLATIQESNVDLYNDFLATKQQADDMAYIDFYNGQLWKLQDYVNTVNTNFLKQYENLWTVNTKDLYKEIYNAPELQSKSEEVTQVEQELTDLQITLDWIEDDLTKEATSNMSASQLQARIAKRQKDLIPEYRRLTAEYEKKKLDYNSLLQSKQVEFQFAQEDAKAERAYQEQILKTQYGMTMQAFEKQEWLIMQSLDFAQKEYWQKRDMTDKLTLMNIQEDMRREAMMFDNDYIQNNNRELKRLDRGDGAYTAVDPFSWEVVQEYWVNSSWNMYESFLSDEALWYTLQGANWKNKQCWQFVNDYLQNQWLTRVFWNEYSQKKGKINSTVPQAWAIAIMWSPTSPEYWHVAVVESVNEDWTINIIDANWNWDWKVWNRTISHLDVDWYYVPPQKEKYNPNLWPSYINYVMYGKNPTKDQIESLWGIEEFWDQAMSYYVEKTTDKYDRLWFDFYDPSLLISSDLDTRKTVEQDLNEYAKVAWTMDKLIDLVDKEWLWVSSLTGHWAKVASLARELQIYAKWEKQFNLWVLNWPDLTILEWFLPTPTYASWQFDKKAVMGKLYEAKTFLIDSYDTALRAQWIRYRWVFNTDPYKSMVEQALNGWWSVWVTAYLDNNL